MDDARLVRFGSKADVCGATAHVRFTPNSGHAAFGITESLFTPASWADLWVAKFRLISPEGNQ
jgi:hypothetical protein